MGCSLPHEAEELLNERFQRDSLISLATLDGDRPSVRSVNGYYEDGSFYVITHALSAKMQQIARHSAVAVCGDWFTAHGTGENMGHILLPENEAIAHKLREAFASWYSNGHVNEQDPNTCILRICLTDGVLFSQGRRFDLQF